MWQRVIKIALHNKFQKLQYCQCFCSLKAYSTSFQVSSVKQKKRTEIKIILTDHIE